MKGVHVSVDMLEHLRERNIPARLIITDTQRIVDWNQELVLYRWRILDRLHETGIADMVEFRSAAYDQMAALYGDVDVVVYPTIGGEPFGLVPLEAMSMELPVIGSRSGGDSGDNRRWRDRIFGGSSGRGWPGQLRRAPF